MNPTKGKAFFFRDNVDTDQILPGFAMSYPSDRLGEVAMGGSDIPDFAKKAKSGDIVVAGENFGCGSSREQAPVALKSAGVAAVVAGSFARIFRRNAINIGLPVVLSKDVEQARSEASPEDEFSIDLEKSVLVNLGKNKTYPLVPLAASSLETLRAGGLINKVREKLLARGEKLSPAAK